VRPLFEDFAEPSAAFQSLPGLRLQFGTEAGWEIKHGKRGRLLKNCTYAGITPDFWNSCDAITNGSEPDAGEAMAPRLPGQDVSSARRHHDAAFTMRRTRER
jgi:hypothetical protein